MTTVWGTVYFIMITIIEFNTNLPILAVGVIVPVLDPAMVNRHKIVTTQLVAMVMREGNIVHLLRMTIVYVGAEGECKGQLKCL